MELGIIGLARAGKTSLFNAATRGGAATGAYSSRERPNVGAVRVPDERLDALSAVFEPKRTTHAEVRWVDYPAGGLGGGDSDAPFLAELANMDALVHVVRAFPDEAVPHPEGSVDPHRDVESLDLELTFADLALIERRLGRLDSEARSLPAAERGALERDRALLTALQGALEEGRAIRALELTETERHWLTRYQFVTRRPLLLLVNVGEDQPAAELEAEFTDRHGGALVVVVALAAKLEAELAALEPGERAEFRRELGLELESPLDRAIRSAYDVLGLLSFFTVSDEECRAWTLPRGATALDAAGEIHSDMERGFIRAEVARWDRLVEAGSLAALRQQGALRIEGKSYVVQDGDVVHILFNL